MGLSTYQIVALGSLPGVGKQSILKVGRYCQDNMDPMILSEVLSKYSIKKKSPEGNKIPITIDDLNDAFETASRLLSQSNTLGIKAISYYDPSFPQSLRDTKSENGKRSDPPIILFYKGNIKALSSPGLAVIGTRENTPGAEKAGIYLAEEFAKRGFCIVSGLALGCDTIGHRGALKAGGRTIAFLAHGLDTIYPAQNKKLAEEIIANEGLLLSEYPIGISVSRYNLVARDRLQAGLSLATLVIQTGIKGGTMHAAITTANAGKPLFVVKYSDKETDGHEKTQGNHFLVTKYHAQYITGKDDLDNIAASIKKRSNPTKPVQKTLLG